MKKFTLVVLILSMILCLTGCGKKATEGLEFDAVDGSYVVTGYHGTDVDVVIPDTYNDIPVVGIEEEVFYGSDIQTIELGENITFIGDEAFCEASMLKSIRLPKALSELGEACFDYCVSLETVVFEGDKITELSDGLFYECTALNEIKLPAKLETVGDRCFRGCTSVKEITLPSTVSFVNGAAFSGWTNEQTITVCSDTAGWMQHRDYTTSAYGQTVTVTIQKAWNENCDAQIIYK